jgi:hypothetical protein
VVSSIDGDGNVCDSSWRWCNETQLCWHSKSAATR